MADGAAFGIESLSDQKLVLSPAAPLDSGREFIRRQHTTHRLRTLHHQNDAFFVWEGSHYRESAEEEIRSNLYRFLDSAFVMKDEKLSPFLPNRSRVANVLEAVAAEAQLPTHLSAPMWLDARLAPAPGDLICFANGLLHLPTRKLLPHTPALFAMNALPFSYEREAAEPSEWLDFLDALWPDDLESIATLQEMFGLFLTGETRHQKAF